MGGPRWAVAGRKIDPHPPAAAAIASRWSRRKVLTASRACHRSAVAMVIDALASALVALWSTPSTCAAPAGTWPDQIHLCWLVLFCELRGLHADHFDLLLGGEISIILAVSAAKTIETSYDRQRRLDSRSSAATDRHSQDIRIF